MRPSAASSTRVARALEQLAQQHADVLVVVDDEDPWPFVHTGFIPSRSRNPCAGQRFCATWRGSSSSSRTTTSAHCWSSSCAGSGTSRSTYDEETGAADLSAFDAAVIEPGDERGLRLARALRATNVPVLFTSIYPAEDDVLALAARRVPREAVSALRTRACASDGAGTPPSSRLQRRSDGRPSNVHGPVRASALSLALVAALLAGCGSDSKESATTTERPQRTSRRASCTRSPARSRRSSQVTHAAEDVAPGFVFIAQKGGKSGRKAAPVIADNRGRIRWFHQLADPLEATDFRTQTYEGKPVLTWWQGAISKAGVGRGEVRRLRRHLHQDRHGQGRQRAGRRPARVRADAARHRATSPSTTRCRPT